MVTSNDIHTEADDPMLLSTEAARRLLGDAPWRRFAVLGDSIAQGVRDPSPGYLNLGWADRVADILTSIEPAVAYRNTGRQGATSAQVVAEQLDEIIEFRPDLVHIVCGGNDLFTGHGSIAALRTNLDTLFGALARTGAQLSTFTMADVWDLERMAPMRPMRAPMARVNEVIRATAARYDAVLVDFWDHPLRLRPDLMSADLIHFTASGHAVVAAEVIRALGRRVSAH
ncbi:SGNH/GDSL hydrolase family protein [Nocardia arthritidis]|nr:SGNH/GDSL hydrolase family protein [Nocardia arthritidis]